MRIKRKKNFVNKKVKNFSFFMAILYLLVMFYLIFSIAQDSLILNVEEVLIFIL
jgi:hypothetical protein